MTRVRYTNRETGEKQVLELQGDPFAVCDKVQRRLFPVLSEEGWERMLVERKRRAERERKER